MADKLKVDSSVMKFIEYDEKKKDLKVDFHDGTHWSYHGVPKNTFNELAAVHKSGRSVGAFFNLYIRNNYTATQNKETE